MKHGFGGVISFGIAADDKAVERFCAALKVVTFAVSLGHDESLIFPQPSYDERINLYPEKFRKGFIRFSIGLEDPDDIIGDPSVYKLFPGLPDVRHVADGRLGAVAHDGRLQDLLVL